MKKKNLQIQQLDNKMQAFAALQRTPTPSAGWVKAIRTALGMTMQQLGNKLSMTKQSVKAIENREMDGSITINTLRETAKALDMQLVYGFVANDGSLDALIERKARELASQIVNRTSQSMKLEDQENTQQRIKKAIDERVAQIKNEMPKTLWD